MATNGAPVPELPSLDVAAALAPATRTNDLAVPFTPLGVTPGALPLLVQMPDGERRQIELPATATVRDLRNALPDDSHWDVSFNGQPMRDDSTLANYNIPDAYGHAGGLLKMISDSGDLDTEQKVEALNSACNIVATISRGETDMAALISAALDDTNPAPAPGSPQQPHLRSVRRGKRSFLSLNLSDLPPPSISTVRAPTLAAPPTPSQLIQKLSATRPDLYPPTTASRMLAEDAGTPNGAAPSKAEPAFASRTDLPAPSASTAALYPIAASPPAAPGESNGDLKRIPTSTWFSEFARNITPFANGKQTENQLNADHSVASVANSEHIGDSEDEHPSSSDGDKRGGTAGGDSHGAESATGSATGGEEQSHGDGSRPGSSAAGSGAPQPKKRGRKRKNPELSEEERKLLRQAQNRASAKQSRMRRKVMAAEYEKRVNTLEGENETLRDTVAALSDRLHFLQTLLTVSVQKRPPGAPPM